MGKIVYHGSHDGNIEMIKSHVSTHQKQCIYAADNMVIAMLFMNRGMGDLDTIKIYDNGIGIKEEDLPRVFDKTYTGKNGRVGKNSTGMGLYIVKRLCKKLGHQISIKSREGEFTCVKISFLKDDYYKVLEKGD